MVQVLVAGLIALASKWLLDGGIRRRDRHVIREELELADILGDRPEAEQLRASAEARLQRYLRPPLAKRAAPMLRTAAIFVAASAFAIWGVMISTNDDTSATSKIGIALAVGAASGTLAQLAQLTVEALLRLRETKARVAARQEGEQAA